MKIYACVLPSQNFRIGAGGTRAARRAVTDGGTGTGCVMTAIRTTLIMSSQSRVCRTFTVQVSVLVPLKNKNLPPPLQNHPPPKRNPPKLPPPLKTHTHIAVNLLQYTF